MKRKKKVKRLMTKAQQKAVERNWNKRIIKCALANINITRQSKEITFKEKMKLLKCEATLKEIITDWKPTL